MNCIQKRLIAVYLIICSINLAFSGPILGAACSAGCAAVQVACYSASGFTFGTVAAAAAPAAIVACNTAFGTCMTACAPIYLIPGP
jgi:hypothetical protein